MIDPADYGIDNLPFGIVSTANDDRKRAAVAFENSVVDLDALVRDTLLDAEMLRGTATLNDFLAAGLDTWRAVRARLQHLLSSAATSDERSRVAKAMLPRDAVTMHLPVAVGDYVDFYSSLEHATNLGRILRPNGEPLLPNYRHIPIGYHGRSGTVVVSGTPVRRPNGQRKAPDDAAPTFGPSTLLDVELEMGWIAGAPSTHGAAGLRRRGARARLRLRAAQRLERARHPSLGISAPRPISRKSFATSISPWIVTLDALEPFRIGEPLRDPKPLSYLRAREPWAYDIELEMLLQTAAHARTRRSAAHDHTHEPARHVLDRRAAARARHLERCEHSPRRSVRHRHDLRHRPRHARLVHRADVARRKTGSRFRAARRAHSSKTATR